MMANMCNYTMLAMILFVLCWYSGMTQSCISYYSIEQSYKRQFMVNDGMVPTDPTGLFVPHYVEKKR